MKVPVWAIVEYLSCPKKAYFLCYKKVLPSGERKSKYRLKGIEMHERLVREFLSKSWDRQLYFYHLGFKYGIEREFRGFTIVGKPDALDVIYEKDPTGKIVGKKISIIEFKTTGQERPALWQREHAIFQAQIYRWLTGPTLDSNGLKFHDRDSVQWYQQEPEEFMFEEDAVPLDDIEEILSFIIDTWLGLKPIRYPPIPLARKICRCCSKEARDQCDYFQNQVRSKEPWRT